MGVVSDSARHHLIILRRSASCRDQCLVRIVAEMRKHPGGRELNLAMFATVQPGSLRCSAFMAHPYPLD
jgi:hypothetical protein